MKKLLAILSVFIIVVSFGACGVASLDNTGTTPPTDGTTLPVTDPTSTAPTNFTATDPTVTTEPKPTEPEPTEPATIQITAPFDLFAENPGETWDVELYIVEDYLLFTNLVVERQTIYVDGTNFIHIYIYPGMQDESIPTVDLIFEARTNYNGFYTPGLSIMEGYAGMKTEFTEYIKYTPNLGTPQSREDAGQQPDRVWIDVLVKNGDHILGVLIYEVVPLLDVSDNIDHAATIEYRYCESYAPIDGKYQPVTEEFVNARIEAYHSYAQENKN